MAKRVSTYTATPPKTEMGSAGSAVRYTERRKSVPASPTSTATKHAANVDASKSAARETSTE